MRDKTNDIRNVSDTRLTEAKALADFSRDLVAVARLRLTLTQQRKCPDYFADETIGASIGDLAVLGECASILRRLRDGVATTSRSPEVEDLALRTLLMVIENCQVETVA